MGQMTLLGPPAPPEPAVDGSWGFRVDGDAVPQGSMKATLNRHTGRVVMFPSNAKELERWRDHVAATAKECRLADWKLLDGPVLAAYTFIEARSERDYLADGVTLRSGARRYPNTAPDLDKLARAMNDALEGVAYSNDGRIVSQPLAKRFAELDEAPGVEVLIVPL